MVEYCSNGLNSLRVVWPEEEEIEGVNVYHDYNYCLILFINWMRFSISMECPSKYYLFNISYDIKMSEHVKFFFFGPIIW